MGGHRPCRLTGTANGGRHRCRPPLPHRLPIRFRTSGGWHAHGRIARSASAGFRSSREQPQAVLRSGTGRSGRPVSALRRRASARPLPEHPPRLDGSSDPPSRRRADPLHQVKRTHASGFGRTVSQSRLRARPRSGRGVQVVDFSLTFLFPTLWMLSRRASRSKRNPMLRRGSAWRICGWLWISPGIVAGLTSGPPARAKKGGIAIVPPSRACRFRRSRTPPAAAPSCLSSSCR